MTRIAIYNGPNLNLLGVREPEIYGSTTLDAIRASCSDLAGLLGCELDFRQTNHEGVMVDWLQEARTDADAVIINPAGLSFYSVPVLDALRMIDRPVIELHISNVHARDEHHRHSMMSGAVTAVVCGLGVYGYTVALLSAARLLGAVPDSLPASIGAGPG